MSKNILNFEKISDNMALPEVKKGPITRNQLVDYASASGDYNKLHFDESFAKKTGLESCIAHGMLVMALAGSYLNEWAKGGVMRSFKIKFVGVTKENDTLTFKGKVAKKYQEKGENYVEVNFSSEAPDKKTTSQGSAVFSFK